MSQAALIRAIAEILSQDDKYDPITAIADGEKKRGYRVVRPDDEPWFRATDWHHESVASVHGNIVRLVLLHSFESGKGAFTRTVKDICDAGFIPAVIDPTPEFAEALKRRGWHGRKRGRSFETYETVWRQRK